MASQKRKRTKRAGKADTKTSGTTKKHFNLSLKARIMLIVLAGVVVIGLFLFQNRTTILDRLSLTYLDQLNKDNLAYTPQASFDNRFEIRDYTIYGESLVLYKDRYNQDDYDDLYGRIAMLKSLEGGEEYFFTFSGGVDNGIELGSLPPGVYEVYVYDDYTPQRVYMNDKFESDPFITIRRNKEVTSIVLDADSDFLHKFDIEGDQNYLYLTVTDQLPRVKTIDVIIDPSGLAAAMSGPIYEEGYNENGFEESRVSYQLAMQVQSYLEDAGVRTEITRDADEAKTYYGTHGRLALGYEKQAKVYLGLSMSEEDEPYPYILSSPFTSGSLANEIAWTMQNNGVLMSNVSSLQRLNEGTGFDQLNLTAEDTLSNFSSDARIRETGGKATYAGQREGMEANANHSDSNGLYGILFCYASMENPGSQQYYLENQDAIARSIAQGILNYFQIVPEQEPQEDQ